MKKTDLALINRRRAIAELEGVKAFEAGKPRAPFFNKPFVDDALAQKDLKASDIFGWYVHGWDIASLANDALLEDMPSVIELKRIRAICAQIHTTPVPTSELEGGAR